MISDPPLHWWTEFLLRIIAAIAIGATTILLLDYTADVVSAAHPDATTVSVQDTQPAAG
jgi:hypothetical protein